MITINPAIQLGIEDRVGSLEVNKDGDIAVFENHPLSIYARPVLTVVDGTVRFDIENDAHDIRLDIDPDEKLPTFYEEDQSHESCLEGVEGHHHHNHQH